jgi:hypothetical protein
MGGYNLDKDYTRLKKSHTLACGRYANTDVEAQKFLVPDWGDIVDSGIGWSYRDRPARLHMLASKAVSETTNR